MHWNVVAPFIDNLEGRNTDWLAPFVPDQNCQFTSILRPGQEVNWHERNSPVTSPSEWWSLWQQSRTAVKTVQGGIITVLPQLTTLVGIQKALLHKNFPLISWWFNTNLYTGYKHALTRTALQSVDRFIVHNTAEREAYSRWYNLPIDRFEFVPMQIPIFPLTETEDTETPFILALGSAYRDYALFFEVVSRLGFRTIVIAGPRALEGLTIPPNVETPFGLKKTEIHSLMQRARFVVLPMVETGIVAGTVTLVEALAFGCPLIVSNRRGVEDYIQHNITGHLVQPGSLTELTNAIHTMWHNEALRDRLRQQSRQYAINHLSDEAVGAALGRILAQFEPPHPYSPVSNPLPHSLL
jgi:glycosyltransferase involved in cell wall biosynthesis